MAQKVAGFIKLQIPAGKATPAPPVGPALKRVLVNQTRTRFQKLLVSNYKKLLRQK